MEIWTRRSSNDIFSSAWFSWYFAASRSCFSSFVRVRNYNAICGERWGMTSGRQWHRKNGRRLFFSSLSCSPSSSCRGRTGSVRYRVSKWISDICRIRLLQNPVFLVEIGSHSLPSKFIGFSFSIFDDKFDEQESLWIVTD